MKTKLYYGIRLVPSYANVEFVADKYKTNYTVTYTYDFGKTLAHFLSVKVKDFGISNAICLN